MELLNDEGLYDEMSEAAIKKVQDYDFDAAAEGFIKACDMGGDWCQSNYPVIIEAKAAIKEATDG